MSNPTNELRKERPLRFVLPEYYRMLLELMEEYHLHPFDIKATVITEEEGWKISLRYGEGLVQERSITSSHETIHHVDHNVIALFRETVVDCKKTMISDYYKFMKA